MIDIDVLITGGVGIITTFASGFVSYIFTKRKYDAEVDSDRISNMEKSLEFYERNQDVNKKILDDLVEENNQFREENKQLKEQLDKYEEVIKKLHDQNTSLEERISKLESSLKSSKSKKDSK